MIIQSTSGNSSSEFCRNIVYFIPISLLFSEIKIYFFSLAGSVGLFFLFLLLMFYSRCGFFLSTSKLYSFLLLLCAFVVSEVISDSPSGDSLKLIFILLFLTLFVYSIAKIINLHDGVLYSGMLMALNVSAALVFLEIFTNIIGYDFFDNVRNAVSSGSTSLGFYGVNRPRSFLPEPSYLSVYFFVLHVYFSDYPAYNKYPRLLSLLLLLVTQALSGFILLVVYYLSIFVRRTSLFSINLRSVKKIIFGALFVSGATVFFYDNVTGFLNFNFFRLLGLIDLVGQGHYIDSDGARGNSLFIIVDAFMYMEVNNLLFGFGYQQYIDYIVRIYPLSQYASNLIPNALVVFFLSFGLIGFVVLVWFLFLITDVVKPISSRVASFILILLFLMFAGNTLSYFIWVGLLLTLLSLSRAGLMMSPGNRNKMKCGL